jgi:hypothetical protein
MSAKSPTIALLYDDDAYVETLARPPHATSGPVGLMGRQVAGKEFLDAYLTHGDYSELAALVRNRPSAQSISNYWRTHPAIQGTKRQLRIVDEKTFHTTFLPTPVAPVLHLPRSVRCPLRLGAATRRAWIVRTLRTHAHDLQRGGGEVDLQLCDRPF